VNTDVNIGLMSLRDEVILGAKLLRRAARRFAQSRRFQTILDDTPILFANSFPKSGTHLLVQVLQGFTQLGPAVNSGLPPILTFEGTTGVPRPARKIQADLKRLLPGDIAYGHLHAVPETVSILCKTGVAPYFIYRDPRDVVVSHVYYVTDIATDHVHHQYYRNVLQTFEERLQTSILGRPEVEIPFPNIRERFSPYLNWLEQQEVLSLRFEDFIENQNLTLNRVIDHAQQRGFPLKTPKDEAVHILSQTIKPKKSPTFRKGEIGNWRKRFSGNHKKTFKDVTGDLLILLGYEKNNDW
jgi:hypothetical protein